MLSLQKPYGLVKGGQIGYNPVTLLGLLCGKLLLSDIVGGVIAQSCGLGNLEGILLVIISSCLYFIISISSWSHLKGRLLCLIMAVILIMTASYNTELIKIIFKGMVNSQNSRDKGPPECNSARG